MANTKIKKLTRRQKKLARRPDYRAYQRKLETRLYRLQMGTAK